MADEERQGSIFEEMMARRSRSEDLNARAIERGLAVLSVEVAASVSADEEQIELTPVIEAEENEFLPVSEDEIQEEVEFSPEDLEPSAEELPAEDVEPEGALAVVDDALDAPEEEVPQAIEEAAWEPESLSESIEEAASDFVEEEELVAEDVQQEPQYFSDIDSLDNVEEAVEPEVERVVAEVEEIEEVESPPVSAEQMIVESDDLLGEAPEFDVEAEVTMVAEELVDRIGPIVDIQSLPKTQPSRVLSKTTKPKEEPPLVESKQPVEEAQAPDKGVDYADTLEEATQVKKKKKKVSLLDSYFKGL